MAAGWLSALKDTAITATVRQIVAARIAPYGKLADFQINPAIRQINLSILLDGEPEAVDLKVQGYQIFEKNGSVSLLIPVGAFSASRPWLAQLLNTEIAGRTFQIPPRFAAYARTLAG